MTSISPVEKPQRRIDVDIDRSERRSPNLRRKALRGCKVLLGPGIADHPGDFADRDIETGDQGLRAVAAKV
jgi:hypothetical protein